MPTTAKFSLKNELKLNFVRIYKQKTLILQQNQAFGNQTEFIWLWGILLSGISGTNAKQVAGDPLLLENE